MGILSDDIFEVEKATAKFTVSVLQPHQMASMIYNSLEFAQRGIAEDLERIPISDLSDEVIFQTVLHYIKPCWRERMELVPPGHPDRFYNHNGYWQVGRRRTKYSVPTAFIIIPER